MSQEVRWSVLVRRLRWDLQDPLERKYYGYWLLWEVPGTFGNALRGRYVARRMRSCGANLRVLPGARFRSLERLVVGDNVLIGADNFWQSSGGLRVGSNVRTGPGVKIWSGNHNYDDPDVPVNRQGYTEKEVIIEDDVEIGANTFILPGAVLSRGCRVQPGAIVGGKVYRPFSIIAGNPARVVGLIDEVNGRADQPADG
ncbi:MAG TPA: acyltransferase [Longimicrobiaceae bacterium]